MAVENKGFKPQLPVDEIANIIQSPRVVTRDVIETRVARHVYELNAGTDIVPDTQGFPTFKDWSDWKKHVDAQPSMGD